MTDVLYSRLLDGSIETLFHKPFNTEDDLQVLLADHVELLDGVDAQQDAHRETLLVKREHGIADSEDAGHRWALDLLLVDHTGLLTLVEVKRAGSSELRRRVVGQMVEYVTHASKTWSSGSIRSSLEQDARRRNVDPDAALQALIASRPGTIAEFWSSVDRNLEQGNFRLLFVSDGIPSELEDEILFLNDHMPRIVVEGLEIKRYRGATQEVFIPRSFGGRRSPPQIRRANMEPEAFFDGFEDEAQRDAAVHIFERVELAGAKVAYGTIMATIRCRSPRLWNQWITLAWLYPPNVTEWGRGRTKLFSFGVEAMLDNPDVPEELSTILREWLGKFADDRFAENVSHNRLMAYAIDYDDVVVHQDMLVDRLDETVNALREL